MNQDDLPLYVVRKNLKKDEDNIPLYIVRRNLIRKQMVIESNKKHIKEKNRNMYVLNGIIQSCDFISSVIKIDESKNMIKTF